MKIFLSGGCKNGKSTLAETCVCRLADPGRRYYLATMIPHDAEDEERIRRHRAARAGKGFQTVECGRDLLRQVAATDGRGAYLLDSVTALLANEMFPDGAADPGAPERVCAMLEQLYRRLEHLVVVSDFIYSDDLPYSAATEAYRRALAQCDRTLARLSDTVAEVCLGQTIVYKGSLPL